VATSPLAPFQAANDPDRPLAALSKPELDAAFAAIATAIDVADALGSLANSLAIVDETYETLEAAVQGRSQIYSRP
jgi:hypothetical protein